MRMNLNDSVSIRARWESAIHQVGLNEVANLGGESFFLTPRTWVEVNDMVGMVVGLLGIGQELGREQLKMVADQKNLGLCVEVVH